MRQPTADMNLIAFDLETNSDPRGWDRKSKVGITCAAVHGRFQTDLTKGPIMLNKAWVAGLSNVENPVLAGVVDYVEAIQGGGFKVAEVMSEGEVELMLEELLALLRPQGSLPANVEGRWPTLVTFNGVGYDFPVIVSNIPHRLEDIKALALDSLDPLFQFTRTLGWPIGLDKIAQVMLGQGKPEGMDGSVAAVSWPERAAEIVSYCHNDCVVTLNVVEAISAEKQVRWFTQSGKESAKPASQFKVGGGWGLVKAVMGLPEVDRAWMSDYSGQFDLEAYTGWMNPGGS